MMFWKKSLMEVEEASGGFSWPTVALMTLSAMLFASWIGRNIFSLSFRILEYQRNIGLDYAMGVLWWVIIGAGILLIAGRYRSILAIAWAAKFMVALVVMLFYEQHYPLDAYWYFGVKVTGEVPIWPEIGDVRKEIIPSFKELHQDQFYIKSHMGTENLIRCLLLIGNLTGPYYHALKVWFAFFGLLGSWFFYRAAVSFLDREWPAAFFLLALFPSMVFWSSILGKDPLQFFFLGIYAYGSVRWLKDGHSTSFVYLGIGLWGTYIFRPWSALLAGGVILVATLLGRSQRWQRICCASAILLAAIYSGALTSSTLEEMFHLNPEKADLLSADPSLALEVLAERAKGMSQDTQGTDSGGGSGIAIDLSEGTANLNLVEGLWAGLYRPLPFDARNIFVLLASVENTILLILSLRALLYIRWAYFRDPLLLWSGLYTFGWAMMYGFIVMANFGSGARYKLQMIPFFVMFLLFLNHKEGRALLEARLSSYRKQADSNRVGIGSSP